MKFYQVWHNSNKVWHIVCAAFLLGACGQVVYVGLNNRLVFRTELGVAVSTKQLQKRRKQLASIVIQSSSQVLTRKQAVKSPLLRDRYEPLNPAVFILSTKIYRIAFVAFNTCLSSPQL